MSTPPIGEALRGLVAGARNALSGLSQTDRSLAAATLVGVAVVLAWPRNKPVPQLVHKVGRLGQHAYDRRAWWIG